MRLSLGMSLCSCHCRLSATVLLFPLALPPRPPISCTLHCALTSTAGYNPGSEVLDVLATAVEAKLDEFTSQVGSWAVNMPSQRVSFEGPWLASAIPCSPHLRF